MEMQLHKCVRYKDYKTAIFLSTYFEKYNKEYYLISAILCYENLEYHRAIKRLKAINTCTSKYYLALCYKQLKKYSDAIDALNAILHKKLEKECSNDIWISSYYLNTEDIEYYYQLLGELHTLKGKASSAMTFYQKSFIKIPLLSSIENIFYENTQIISNGEGPLIDYYYDLMNINENLDLTKYDLNNDYNIYFLNKAGFWYAKYNYYNKAKQAFKMVVDSKSYIIDDLGIYSTLLWRLKEEELLGILSKTLIEKHPKSYITWIVIGNYYSVKDVSDKSMLCFTKSIQIEENYQAYSLLGSEANAKDQYADAQKYFKSSLSMLENNGNALLGLGIAYEGFNYGDKAEKIYKQAISKNCSVKEIQIYLIRYYTKIREYEKALKEILKCFNLKVETHEEIYEIIYSKAGTFTSVEELVICELVEVFLYYFNDVERAQNLLEVLKCRTSSFYKKLVKIETFDEYE